MTTPASESNDSNLASLRALVWFQRVVWAGIIANVAVALVSIAYPEAVLRLLKLDPASPLIWPRFAAFLLILLSGFYLLAAIDPARHRFASIFAVVCRFAGVAFFTVVGGRYTIFGLFELLFGAPQAILLWLAWRRQRPGADQSNTALAAVLAGLVAFGALSYGLVQWFMSPVVPAYASDQDFFKYGSIGNDAASGIPYKLWAVMPEVCAHHLPRGQSYAAFGFLWEEGRNPALDPPIGFSKARAGVDRMAINCAICHTTSAGLPGSERPQYFIGGPSNTVDIQGYQRFLSRCAADERFSHRVLIRAMEKKVGLSFLERLGYRFFLIPIVRKRLKEQGESFAWTGRRPDWGPGRIDPFNPVKFGMLKLRDDNTIGNSDMQAIWDLRTREADGRRAPMHWDGLNNSIHEVVVSSALGDGAVADEFNLAAMNRLGDILRKLPPPPSPHRPDPSAVGRGEAVFRQHCAECHAPDGPRTLTVIPQKEVGTDIHRLHMWTEAARDTYNAYDEGYRWNFSSFRKTDGYIAEPLRGAWLTAPYLHNGSVPTLRDLLEPPDKRPVLFMRGLDTIDAKNGGFVAPPCDPRERPKAGFCFDTRIAGNSNRGHVYGTALSAAEKDDLLAYLLTL